MCANSPLTRCCLFLQSSLTPETDIISQLLSPRANHRLALLLHLNPTLVF